MNRTRRLSLSLLLLLVTAWPAFAERVAAMPAPTGYVDDYAGVISPASKTDLESICNEVHNKTRAQIFLVTVKSTDGEEIQTFANELFAKWKIGEKKTDRGVLLLFAVNDRKRWIEVGYGLEGILNDARVGDIGREMVPDLQAARYDAATRIGVLEVAQIIAADAGVTLDESLDNSALSEQPASPEPRASSPVATAHGSPWLVLLVVPLFLGPVVAFFVLFHFARKRGTAGTGGTSGNSDSSEGSSFSSGSDDSFGGGDGGSSGGGGAGGDW